MSNNREKNDKNSSREYFKKDSAYQPKQTNPPLKNPPRPQKSPKKK